MPITVTSGTLDRHLTLHASASVTAYVVYTMSNGATSEMVHGPIPEAALLALATAAGRTSYTPADICTWVETNIPDLAGTPISPATPPAPPVDPV